MTTPWEQARERQSRRQEQRIGKLPGGQKQVNSGRVWFSKRDVRLNGFLVEARITDKQSYKIEKAEFERITRDAIQTPPGLLPALMPEIDGLRLIVMREDDFTYLHEYIGILEGRINASTTDEPRS